MWLFWVNIKRMCFYFTSPPFLSFSSNVWLVVVRGHLALEREEKENIKTMLQLIYVLIKL